MQEVADFLKLNVNEPIGVCSAVTLLFLLEAEKLALTNGQLAPETGASQNIMCTTY